MPSQFDRGKTEGEPHACWALIGISGSIIGEVILAEKPELLVGRSDWPGDVRGNAGCQTGLHLFSVVVADVRHGIEATVKDFFSLQCHRAEPLPIAGIVRHVVGKNELVLTVNRHLRVVADLSAAALPELHRPTLWIRE